jgi:hypothetical protein
MNTKVTDNLAVVIQDYFKERGRQCLVRPLRWAESVPGVVTVAAHFELSEDCLAGAVLVAFNRLGSTYGVNVRFGGYIANQHGWAPCQASTYHNQSVPPSGQLADELQHLCRVVSEVYQ